MVSRYASSTRRLAAAFISEISPFEAGTNRLVTSLRAHRFGRLSEIFWTHLKRASDEDRFGELRSHVPHHRIIEIYSTPRMSKNRCGEKSATSVEWSPSLKRWVDEER